jgi:hypothetical protein
VEISFANEVLHKKSRKYKLEKIKVAQNVIELYNNNIRGQKRRFKC